MKRAGIRTRIFAILILFAIVPALVLTLIWGGALNYARSLVSGGSGWDEVASSWQRVETVLGRAQLTTAQRAVLAAHHAELEESLTQSQKVRFLARRAAPLLPVLGLVALALLAVVSSRVAGHLSRQLSRPIHELVGWTERIGKSEPIPIEPVRRGAPEFEVLRVRMRAMASELEVGRDRAVEAERLRAFRETARQVAHELKNPLTPIRFAVARLRRDAPADLTDTVDVLDIESQRLESLARSFSQFGRLPEGPASDIDVGEMARYAARSTVPPEIAVDLRVADDVPMVRGHHDALARALSNVLLNAVDACRSVPGRELASTNGGTDRPRRRGAHIEVEVARERSNGHDEVAIAVRDTGVGIAPEALARIWEPYVTSKPGGTGLGLAITRQTILAHRGDVRATSIPGEGTEIRFTIPVATTGDDRADIGD